MKKLFLLHTLLAILLFSAVGCSSSGDDGDTNPLVGFWHIATEEGITSIRIDDNGTGEATIYTYTDDIWETSTRLLQYTLANDYLAVKIDGEDAICGRIAITGTSLSISQGDDIYMLTGYNGDEAKIKELQTHIEENYAQNKNEGNDSNGEDITIQPPFNDVVEDFWHSENDVAAMLATIYMELIGFEAEQLNLENIRITGKDLYGSVKTIYATSQEVEECWSAAYKAISKCNAMIEHAPAEFEGYINEAKALRCFIYYNIAHLWGKAPYITASDTDAATNSPVLSKEEIFDIIMNEIDEIGTLRESDDRYNDYYIDYETLQTIKGEINISRGNSNTALSLFAGSIPAFSLSLENYSHAGYQAAFGSCIPLYTTQLVTLLKKEARGETEELLLQWQEQEAITYGYWAMLKRTGKAQDITGCKEHEILLPIPESEMLFNAKITQNPGY